MLKKRVNTDIYNKYGLIHNKVYTIMSTPLPLTAHLLSLTKQWVVSSFGRVLYNEDASE